MQWRVEKTPSLRHDLLLPVCLNASQWRFWKGGKRESFSPGKTEHCSHRALGIKQCPLLQMQGGTPVGFTYTHKLKHMLFAQDPRYGQDGARVPACLAATAYSGGD